jgi:hypothetical protein
MGDALAPLKARASKEAVQQRMNSSLRATKAKEMRGQTETEMEETACRREQGKLFGHARVCSTLEAVTVSAVARSNHS